jgi:hypothetical protein
LGCSDNFEEEEAFDTRVDDHVFVLALLEDLAL